MARTPYHSPAVLHLTVVAGGAGASAGISFLVQGIGPAYDSSPVTGSLSAGPTYTSVAPTITNQPWSWAAFNGLSGDNPGPVTFGGYTGTTVSASAAAGTPSGTYTETVATPFGSTTVYVHVATESPLILDQFDDVDGTQLAAHAPDQAPTGGAVSGWRGTAAYSDTIQSNELAVGCCVGASRWARLYAAADNHLVVYADLVRGTAAGELLGIVTRATALDGNSDTSTEYVGYYIGINSGDANTVKLSWIRAMVGGSTYEQEYEYSTVSWIRGAPQRMLALVSDATLTMYLDAAGGSSPTVQRTVSLSSAWTEGNHQYVGYVNNDLGVATSTRFGAVQRNLDVDPVFSAASRIAYSTETVADAVDVLSSTSFVYVEVNVASSTSYVQGTGWLTASLNTTATPASLALVYSAQSLSEGTYQAVVNLSALAANSPVAVTAQLEVYPAPVGSGAMASSGATAGLYHGRLVAPDAGAYRVEGRAEGFRYFHLDGDASGYAVMGGGNSLLWGRLVSAGAANYLVVGHKVIFYDNGWARPDPGYDPGWTSGTSVGDVGWGAEGRPRARIPNP